MLPATAKLKRGLKAEAVQFVVHPIDCSWRWIGRRRIDPNRDADDPEAAPIIDFNDAAMRRRNRPEHPNQLAVSVQVSPLFRC